MNIRKSGKRKGEISFRKAEEIGEVLYRFFELKAGGEHV